MTAKKKTAKKRKPKVPAKKKAKRPKKRWPPFGCGDDEDGRGEDSGLLLDPDPIPFTKVRYRNSSPRPTLVSVVIETEDPPGISTIAIPKLPGLVMPEEVVDVPPQPPLHNVCEVYGTVLFVAGGPVLSHPFHGPRQPYMDWVEIETKVAFPSGALYTEVTYHFQPLG